MTVVAPQLTFPYQGVYPQKNHRAKEKIQLPDFINISLLLFFQVKAKKKKKGGEY